MKYKCKSCGLECRVESNFEPTVCLKTGVICYGWHKVSAPTPKPLSEAILPKLTDAVFDREDCPEWANYAAVNENRTAFFFGNVPNRGCSNPRKKYWTYHHSEMMQIPGEFDSTDWQNSLIERPAKKKLPDWCKVGAWVWCADCRAERKIEAINGNRITVRFPAPDATSYTGDVSEFKPIVPFTLETITPLLPLIVREKGSKTSFTSVIVHASTVGVWIGAASIAISYEQLMNTHERLSGDPCGVLEVEEVAE